MEQHIPIVSRSDVLRVVMRDFGDAKKEEIIELLNIYSSHELDRVHLAILKLSGGDVEKLCNYIELAISDYRDVVSPAEYPNHQKFSWSEISQLSEEEVTKIYKEDKMQYEEWLYAS